MPEFTMLPEKRARPTLNFDQTNTTRRDDGKPWMIAVVRNRQAAVQARLEDHLPLLSGYLATIYRDGEHDSLR
jgi:hypothetical protein